MVAIPDEKTKVNNSDYSEYSIWSWYEYCKRHAIDFVTEDENIGNFDISWYLGYTKNINSFYLEQFSGPWEANIWILKEIGFIGITLMSILVYYYLVITKMVYLGIFGKLSRER